MRRHARPLFACLSLVTLLTCRLAASAQGTLPPLPRIALERFPASARAAVSQAYEQARQHANDPDAVGAFGRVAHAWEQWDAAHEAYTRAQALAPRAFEWHYLDALVLQRLVRHAEAAARLEEAAALSPEYAPARVKLAESLFEAGNLKEAARLFDALSQRPATEPMGLFGKGRIAAATGRHGEAIQLFERAVGLFPEWGSAHYALALSYRALGRRDDARRALELHGRYGATWPALDDPISASIANVREDGRAMVQRGVKLAERGEVDAAISLHEAALKSDPSLVQAHANLISLYGRQGNVAKAEEHYNAVVRADVGFEAAHYDYGVLLGMQGRLAEAEAAYRKAVAINPWYAQAYNNLGEVLERQRKVDAALEVYQKAVEAQPLFRLARLNVGRMLLALGKPAEAVAHFEKLVEPRDAESPRYLFALAAAYVQMGRKEEGIKWATEARQLALHYGQSQLAAAIERDLARLK